MSRPTTTVSIPQSYFIEALTSCSLPSKYLEHFSEDIYNTSLDSRLHKFLYSLVGPVGVGELKTSYFHARLQFEERGLNLKQLDNFYGNPFRFSRSTDELYPSDYDGLINNQGWDEIKSLDESYRTRADDYLSAARLGPTPEGMRLAAKSGLGYNTQIVENYKSLFNQHSDQIFDYNFIGSTRADGTQNVEEFTVIPDDSSETGVREISPEEQHLIKRATDNLKPMNVIQTVQQGSSTVSEVPVKAKLASSEFHQTMRLVTGTPSIPWPKTSDTSGAFKSVYWIESGVEKEAPRNQNDFQQHYQGFHKPSSVSDVSSQAKGQFSPHFIKKFPSLSNALLSISSINDHVWSKTDALADYPEHLTITSKNTGTDTGLINYSYPADYLHLENVKTLTYSPAKFWASTEQTSGDEYLEIDLGSEKAVNFLIFEALGLPLSIKIEYDSGGLINDSGTPIKTYSQVTFDPLYPIDDEIDYDPNLLNKWSTLPYIFTDKNSNLIFTRFIKITFTRKETTYYNQSKFLFDDTVSPAVQRPWPVIVKNLRLGRNV